MTARTRILVVEDDPAQREQLEGFLAGLRCDVRTAGSVDEARLRMDERAPDVVLSDLRLPGGGGLALLAWARERHPQSDFLMMTAFATVEVAVEAMRGGAHDFLTKPLNLDVLEQRLGKLVERRGLDREVRRLRGRLTHDAEHAAAPEGVVAESRAMREALALARRVAASDSTVLVTGETGTGKEVVAQVLHDESPRSDGPFVRVNCAAIPDTLLESELFGHVRGAFTGAERDRKGLFVEAHEGTILLDEIGEMSSSAQVRLLRVLQEKEVLPVGESRPRKVDVRVVAATHRDLERECEAGRFRRDLLYRLAVITIALAPLRERREDVAALVPKLLARYAAEQRVAVPHVAPEALDRLLAHGWPGNVRELQNVLQRALVLSAGGEIRAADLPAALRSAGPAAALPDVSAERPLPQVLDEVERGLIARALDAHGGVITRAARALGIDERVLRYKVQRLGLREPRGRGEADTADPANPSEGRRERRDPGSDGA